VTIPRLIVPSSNVDAAIAMFTARRRWLDLIVLNIHEQVMLFQSTDVAILGKNLSAVVTTY
jgi:hypothetical protein